MFMYNSFLCLEDSLDLRVNKSLQLFQGLTLIDMEVYQSVIITVKVKKPNPGIVFKKTYNLFLPDIPDNNMQSYTWKNRCWRKVQ